MTTEVTDEFILQAYIADMKFRALQPGTIKVRERYIRKLMREVGILTATEQQIIMWLSRDLQPKSRAMWLSNLNTLFDFCIHNKWIAENPCSDIGKPRLHGRAPRPMPQDDIQRALQMATPKMKVWIKLGALEGLRCMEIAGITGDDIRPETMTLRIIGKGSKERFLPLHPDVLASLYEYGIPSDGGRFWAEDDAAAVSRKLNRFLHGTVGTKFTAHTLRHAFGTAIYRASTDLRLTQELMGHASPQTTAGYAAPNTEQAAGVVSGLTI